MVDLNGSYDPNAQPTGDFEPIPAGDYEAEIIESSLEAISKRDNKGKCLVLTWKVTRGEYENRLIWQRLNMWAENMNNLDKVISIAMGQFAAIRKATGKPNVANSEELHHIPCLLRVKVRTDPNGQYAPQNEVGSVKQATNSPAAGSAPAQRAAPSSGGGSAPWRKAG